MSRVYRANNSKKITKKIEEVEKAEQVKDVNPVEKDVKPFEEKHEKKPYKKDFHKPTSQTFNIFMSSYNYEVFNKAKETFFPIVKALGDNRVENNVLEELIDNWKKRIIEVNSAYIEYNKKTKGSTVKEEKN